MTGALALRWLAEFVHRAGDLHSGARGRTTAGEGIATQRRLQEGRSPTYRREVAVTATFEVAGEALELRGRADGVDTEAAPPLVEEYKATRLAPAAAFERDGAVDLAQLELYAALLAREHPNVPAWRLALRYCHPETLEFGEYTVERSADALAAFLAATLAAFGAFMHTQRAHVRARDGWLHDLPFPYERYRMHQRALMRRCFATLCERGNLLLEAPTGSGKSIGVLFPALKSLPATGARRLLFLTGRGTGAAAATAAVRRIDPAGDRLRVITITAKAKSCPVPGMPCDPELCANARGYYDRRAAAVGELLHSGHAGPEEIAAVAARHTVCPFELSLDAALWADLVVLDYNYVLDPMVALQRFANDPETDLLIDEAHQLAPRAADMLSAGLELDVLRAARRSDLGVAERRLRSVERALVGLRRMYGDDVQVLIDRPFAVGRAVARLLDAWHEEQWQPAGVLEAALWQAHRFARAEAWADEGAFRYLLDTGGDTVVLRLACIDPARHIRTVLDGFGAHVRFSGTVTPLDLYQRLHGFEARDRERVAGPFSAEQQCTLVVGDIDTFYRGRAASIGRVVRLVREVAAQRAGRYLVAFPSYEYLHAFAAHCGNDVRDAALAVMAQAPAMDEAGRIAFLRDFEEHEGTVAAAIVLGGIFGESVDFAHAPLAGVIVVGAGVPPPDPLRHATADHFAAEGADGREIAFVQPAMNRVLQVAGRLLRSADDAGVLCLVDPRFREPGFARFFPDHWQPREVSHERAHEEVAKFWRARILSPAPGQAGSGP